MSFLVVTLVLLLFQVQEVAAVLSAGYVDWLFLFFGVDAFFFDLLVAILIHPHWFYLFLVDEGNRTY